MKTKLKFIAFFLKVSKKGDYYPIAAVYYTYGEKD